MANGGYTRGGPWDPAGRPGREARVRAKLEAELKEAKRAGAARIVRHTVTPPPGEGVEPSMWKAECYRADNLWRMDLFRNGNLIIEGRPLDEIESTITLVGNGFDHRARGTIARKIRAACKPGKSK